MVLITTILFLAEELILAIYYFKKEISGNLLIFRANYYFYNSFLSYML